MNISRASDSSFLLNGTTCVGQQRIDEYPKPVVFLCPFPSLHLMVGQLGNHNEYTQPCLLPLHLNQIWLVLIFMVKSLATGKVSPGIMANGHEKFSIVKKSIIHKLELTSQLL